MNKPRPDSTWSTLTPDQKEQLAKWLFEDNLSYPQTLERVQTEFGITASHSSLGRFYQVLARERLREELCEAQQTAAEAMSAEVSLSTLHGAAIKMIGKKLIDCALKPGMAREVSLLTNLMLMNRQQEIQCEWLALARERFQHKAAKAALQALPLASQLAADQEARNAADLQAIKLKLFGSEVLKGMIE